MQRLIKITLSAILFCGYLIFLSACSEDSPLSITHSQTDGSFDGLKKPRSKSAPALTTIQSASGTVYFKPSLNHYAGLGFGHANGSNFVLQPESLTPPEDIAWGENVTITMTVEKDLINNELIYTFGPSGCQFDPPATLWISWSDLGSDTAVLYYLPERGKRKEETPSAIDMEGKKFQVLINHFSRYAVAYSD